MYMVLLESPFAIKFLQKKIHINIKCILKFKNYYLINFIIKFNIFLNEKITVLL